MSPNKTIILVLALLVTSVTAKAQGAAEWKSHRHSLEISTGFPYPMMIHSDVGPEPGSPEELEMQRMWNEGQSKKETMCPNLTVMYSFRFAEAGEVSVFFNVHGYTYAIRQHAKGYTPGMGWDYNVHKVTKVLERGYVNMAVVPGVLFKYYWYNRDFWKWYSGFGVGYFAYGEDILFDRKISPEAILAGTHFGRNHIYGVAELVFGPTGIGPQLGLGYRF